ncbi:hypothetical protein TEA_021106 [Camellia sinensis var. sinensis]|uniref:Transposase Tnp1/En/Spm-like domain-containing protein n=1 Tax=Camellia sinensis var. sinensis TaxID=542762 RepID=A0A4V3WK88_CAMSN|nr:hypothetical protein TEA_021106 [Camellia sinensis var. sinensis]
MKCSGKKLKDWKANIKKNYYKNHLSFDEQKHYKDSRVYADQWEHLIKYWAIEEVKAQSDKNKASRAERKYNHTTGTKSFPRVRKEQKNKLGHSLTRAHMFKVCYTKETGTPEATKAMIATTISTPLDMAARHQAWSLSSIQDASLTQSCTNKANQDTTMDAMKAENLELRSKASHVEHASNNLTNTSNQVGDIVVLKSIIRPTETVAIGVLKSTDASKEVEGEELGPEYWEVHVQAPIKPNESLIRSYGLVKIIGQAIGAHVAWPAPFVISQVMDASREYLYKSSFDQGFGGAGFALSYPLVAAMVKDLEGCLRRYPYLKSADLITQYCVDELGVPLSAERGIHQRYKIIEEGEDGNRDQTREILVPVRHRHRHPIILDTSRFKSSNNNDINQVNFRDSDDEFDDGDDDDDLSAKNIRYVMIPTVDDPVLSCTKRERGSMAFRSNHTTLFEFKGKVKGREIDVVEQRIEASDQVLSLPSQECFILASDLRFPLLRFAILLGFFLRSVESCFFLRVITI